MIQAIDICKSFGEPEVQILHPLNFKIPDGEFVSITGRSGSGKSTLLYILSSLDLPSSGKLLIENQDVTKMSELEIHQFRNHKMGFVFQFHYLLPELTAIENVLMPARKSGQHIAKGDYGMYLLEQFGLDEKAHRLPKQLSGGEQQRVAIARALIMQPKYIFADEPTGNLDSVNGEIVMEILQNISKKQGATVIYVTHDPDFANLATMKIKLADGRLSNNSILF